MPCVALSFPVAAVDAPRRRWWIRFRYPLLGPGMLWERVADLACAGGVDLRMGANVTGLPCASGRVTAVEYKRNGNLEQIECSHVISSMPLGHLVQALAPPALTDVIDASRGLRYRDFLTVALVVDQPQVFDDNWIYIHEPGVLVARIQNYKNWSQDMVGNLGRRCWVWNTSVPRTTNCGVDRTVNWWNWRAMNSPSAPYSQGIRGGRHGGAHARAYPVYDDRYRDCVARLRDYLGHECSNVQVVDAMGCTATTTRITPCSQD